jgi:hypothetical protein
MVISHLTGGLGNQLFQYAAARSLSLHHGVELHLDISSFFKEKLPESELPRNFELYSFKGITEPIISKEKIEDIFPSPKEKSLLQKILPRYRRDVYKQPYFHFDRNFFRSKKQVYLKGGWQSEKYFSVYKDIIFNSFQLKDELIERVRVKAGEISSRPTVGVHIRRGDYLSNKIILDSHGVMPVEYYASGLNILEKMVGNFGIYYFTDDPEWVKKELIPLRDGEIVSDEISKTHFEDFYLLSRCQHTIIANSTFSWWAAWLNPNPEKITIGPKNWFDKWPKDTYDILPSHWLSI